ncbi:MAG: hypothetical protein MJY87_04390 [Fibrobacter sp.]|nr:hypothetical protein [Fibrobacter sp.]
MKKSFAYLALLTATMFAGCTDYLGEFQDEYEDTFAEEMSSDSKDDVNSSDSKDIDKSSDSKDDESSSDSKDVGGKSSDSKNSSSSSTTSSSSSSTADDGQAHCTGTVIYDASDDPHKTAFGTKFSYQKNGTTTDVEADENGFNITLDGFSFASLNFGETKDISSWEGVCFEYTATSAATLYLTNSNSTNANSAATFTMPQSSELQTFEANWSSARIYYGFGFDAVTTLSFGENENKLVIKRITTIAKDVNLNAGASSEDPSTGYILSTNECPGTEIYNENKGNIFKFPVESWNEDNTTTTLTNMSLSGDTGEDGVYFFIADYLSEKTISIEQWGGLCLEYSSTNDMYVEIANVQNSQTSSLASSTLPAQKTKIAYAIPLKAFYDVYVSDDLFFVNGPFNPTEVNRISFTNIDVGTTQASISRITTLYPGVTSE